MRSSWSAATGGADRLEREPGGEPGRDRREDVAAVEGGRERGQPQLLVAQLVGDVDAAVEIDGVHEQPVVRADEEPVAVAAQGDRPPRAAHARVDDREDHGPVRHVGQRVAQHHGPGQHVALGQAVGDVDDPDVGRQPGDHGAAHAGEVVRVPVVAEEADRPVHAANLRRSPVRRNSWASNPGPGRPRRREPHAACQSGTRGRVDGCAGTGAPRTDGPMASTTPNGQARRR